MNLEVYNIRSGLIPLSYREWYECITIKCGISMTKSFVARRLLSLKNPDLPMTKKFISLYGQEYLNQVILWFEKAERTQIAAYLNIYFLRYRSIVK